ncbi:MAG: hypothetical protein XU10_C0052G0001, partial [Chloroflexi bacterium CSP1-4]
MAILLELGPLIAVAMAAFVPLLTLPVVAGVIGGFLFLRTRTHPAAWPWGATIPVAVGLAWR